MDRFKKIWIDPVWSKVISTGVIFIIGIIWSWSINWWPFSRNIPQNIPQNTTMTEIQKTEIQEKVFIREKSAGELMNHLDNFPPLQKESIIANTYRGRWVQWKGKVKDVRSSYNKWKGTFVEHGSGFTFTSANVFLLVVENDGEYAHR